MRNEGDPKRTRTATSARTATVRERITRPSAVSDATTARVLLVEDEAVIARDIESRLRSSGFAVAAVVDTGEEAVAAAGKLSPDLVLMDIRLKGRLDGIEAAGAIRT